MITATPVFCSFAGRNTLSVGRLTFVTCRLPALPVIVSSPVLFVSPGAIPGQSCTTTGSAAEREKPRSAKRKIVRLMIVRLILRFPKERFTGSSQHIAVAADYTSHSATFSAGLARQ